MFLMADKTKFVKLFSVNKVFLIFIFLPRVFLRLIFIGILLLFCSCIKEEPYLYDKVGFDPGGRDQNIGNPDQINKSSVPSYSNQVYPSGAVQQYSAPAQPYQTPYAAQPYYQQQQQYQYQQPPQNYQQQQYYQRQPYQQQNPTVGGSRYYANPYAIPPSAQYPNNYDADQYYVPPAYYNNVEPQQTQSSILNSIQY